MQRQKKGGTTCGLTFDVFWVKSSFPFSSVTVPNAPYSRCFITGTAMADEEEEAAPSNPWFGIFQHRSSDSLGSVSTTALILRHGGELPFLHEQGTRTTGADTDSWACHRQDLWELIGVMREAVDKDETDISPPLFETSKAHACPRKERRKEQKRKNKKMLLHDFRRIQLRNRVLQDPCDSSLSLTPRFRE